MRDERIPTATRIYVNLDGPVTEPPLESLPADGVGLLRLGPLLAGGPDPAHPILRVEQGRGEELAFGLAGHIARVARAVYPRPVRVCFSDLTSAELRALPGGERHEPAENNPAIGRRGCARLVSPDYRPAFRLECRAVREVRESEGLRNVHVLLPFPRLPGEVEAVQAIMRDEGLVRSRDFEVWLSAEVPSAVILAEDFARLCDGFTVPIEGLARLVLAADGASEHLRRLGYPDPADDAVREAALRLAEAARRHGRAVCVAGEGGLDPGLVDFLVDLGVDAVSVPPGALVPTRRRVAEAERRLLLRRVVADRRGRDPAAGRWWVSHPT